MSKENKELIYKLAFNFCSAMGYLIVNGGKQIADIFMENFSEEEIEKLDKLGREHMRNYLGNVDEEVKKLLEDSNDIINADD